MRYLFCNILLFLALSTSLVAQQRPPYPDNSLVVTDYVEMGMPGSAHVWTGPDYVLAMKWLKLVKGADKLSLPRMNSPQSGDLFSRMVAIENLDRLVDKRILLQLRLEMVDSMANAFNELIGLYMEPDQRQERFAMEVAVIQFFRLHLTQRVLDLLDEMAELLGKRAEDEQFQQMIKGQQEAHLQSFQALTGILEDPTERFSVDSRSYIKSGLLGRVDEFTAKLELSSATQLRKQLESLGVNL